MRDDPVVRILAALTDRSGDETTRLCAVCAEVTGLSGAGIMLVADHRPHGSICTSDEVSELLEELQFSYGEGPCVEQGLLELALMACDWPDVDDLLGVTFYLRPKRPQRSRRTVR